MNHTIQYTIVCIIVILALWRMIHGIHKNRKHPGGSCAGCALSKSCSDYKKPKPDEASKEKADCHK